MSTELTISGILNPGIDEETISRSTHRVLRNLGYQFKQGPENEQLVNSIEDPYSHVQDGGAIWGRKKFGGYTISFPYHGIREIKINNKKYYNYTVSIPRSSSNVRNTDYMNRISDFIKSIISQIDFDMLLTSFNDELFLELGKSVGDSKSIGSFSYFSQQSMRREAAGVISDSAVFEFSYINVGYYIRPLENSNDPNRKNKIQEKTEYSIKF